MVRVRSMKKIFLLAMVFTLQGSVVFSADDEKPYERSYSRAYEMYTHSEKVGSEKTFVVRYQVRLEGNTFGDTIYETMPLNQKQLNEFLTKSKNVLVVGVTPTEPVVPIIEEKMKDEVRFIVSFKKNPKDGNVSETQPLNQFQLNHFLAHNPGYLVVGITTTQPIHPPLEESTEIRTLR